MGKLIKIK